MSDPHNPNRYGGPVEEITKEAAFALHAGNRSTAAEIIAKATGQTFTKGTPSDEETKATLEAFLQYLFDHERYVDAASLLWTPNLFDARPRFVKLLFDAMFDHTMNMVPGSSSVGKSYNLGVWMYLDWRRDPMFTNVELVGPSENHLERNLFSHLVKLHKLASIPFAAEVMKLGITTDPHVRNSGIFGVVVPLGKKAAGRLQGGKVTMRPTPHPLLGPTSRRRVMLEEAENIPVGIWDDVTNIVSNVGASKERFKIVAPFNPKDPNGPCAQRCEPVDGWQVLDIETSEQWESKRGWFVTRLDAHKSENVIAGTELYFGLQTKEGLEKSLISGGGVGSPSYYTFCRGYFPPTGIDLAVIPQHLMHDIVGEYVFVDTPEVCAGVDVALDGGDNAIMCLGRTGKASGYRRPPTTEHPKGEYVQFLDAKKQGIRKQVVQLDSIFTLQKGDTTRLVAQIRETARNAAVNGAYLCIDRTGNGAGVHDILVRTHSAYCKGVNGSESPTEKRILEEDQKLPCDEYAYAVTELWFAMRKYIEYNFLKFSPSVPTDPIFNELTGRRTTIGGAKTKVESNKEYKSRGNKSPDRASSLSLMLHGVRLNLDGPPSATNIGVREQLASGVGKQRIGLTDKTEPPL